MQHPARLDQIEAPPDAPEFENIGLCELYVADPELARFARGVSQAGQAEIDRKHVGAGKSLRCFERMLAGATAGDQNIDRCTLVACRDRRLRKLVAQIPRHAGGVADRRRLEPARIRRLLVLLANRNGDFVADRGQRRQQRAQAPLLSRLVHLLANDAGHRVRPAPFSQSSRVRKRMQRSIGSNRDEPDGRNCRCRCEGGLDLLLQVGELLQLFRRNRKNIFVEEALLRQRAQEIELGLRIGAFCPGCKCGCQQHRPCICEKALDRAVLHWCCLQQRAEQWAARYRRNLIRRTQLSLAQTPGPGRRSARNARIRRT